MFCYFVKFFDSWSLDDPEFYRDMSIVETIEQAEIFCIKSALTFDFSENDEREIFMDEYTMTAQYFYDEETIYVTGYHTDPDTKDKIYHELKFVCVKLDMQRAGDTPEKWDNGPFKWKSLPRTTMEESKKQFARENPSRYRQLIS